MTPVVVVVVVVVDSEKGKEERVVTLCGCRLDMTPPTVRGDEGGGKGQLQHFLLIRQQSTL